MPDPNPKRPLIVLVEDDEDDLMLLSIQLRRKDPSASLRTFRSAEEARPFIEENAEQIGLVLTDLRLPGQSGIDLARSLARRLPVYVVSSSRRSRDAHAAVSAGARALLSKPILAADLDRIPELSP